MRIHTKFIMFSLMGLTPLATAQTDLRNTITFKGGQAFNVGGAGSNGSAGTAFGIDYGYRILPNLQIEAGVLTARDLTGELRGANYTVVPDDSFLWLTSGARGILPLKRVELSIGAGGLYGRYSGFPAPFGDVRSHSSWGGYVTGSAAVALDHKRHFWIGVSPRYFISNGTDARDRWVIITGDFSFRF
jgi:hypothetical protein